MTDQREPDVTVWVIGLVVAGAVCLLIAVLLWSTKAKAEPVTPGVAYCALYAREAVRIDLIHTIPVKPEDVTDSYIEALAVKVFKDCVSVLPALLPLPEQHRNLGTWINDMRYLITQRAGTVPAADRPQASVASDEAWRQQCAATYRSWDEETGTVVRRGSHERVRCPCGDGVDCP